VVDVKVMLSLEKLKEKEKRQRAECNINVKGNDLFAESAHEDLYAAVDDLVDKLDRQVVRHKDRITDHQHSAPKRMM
jgi:putative sigma-54 modulation protein